MKKILAGISFGLLLMALFAQNSLAQNYFFDEPRRGGFNLSRMIDSI